MGKESNNIKDYRNSDLLWPSNYLKGAELKGEEAVVTIKRIEPRHELKSKDGTQYLPVIFFRELEKGMILRATNGGTIRKMHGKDPNGWIGKQIILGTHRVLAFGQVYDEALLVVDRRPAALPPSVTLGDVRDAFSMAQNTDELKRAWGMVSQLPVSDKTAAGEAYKERHNELRAEYEARQASAAPHDPVTGEVSGDEEYTGPDVPDWTESE